MLIAFGNDAVLVNVSVADVPPGSVATLVALASSVLDFQTEFVLLALITHDPEEFTKSSTAVELVAPDIDVVKVVLVIVFAAGMLDVSKSYPICDDWPPTVALAAFPIPLGDALAGGPNPIAPRR